MPTNILRLLGLVLMAGLAACGSGSSPGGGAGQGGAGSGGSAGYVGAAPVDAAAGLSFLGCTPIKASALVGCRNPDEPNCETCCSTNVNNFCSKYSSPCFQATIDAVDVPVRTYCSGYDCTPDCTPCAACSTFSEVTLCRLKQASVDCDCAHLDLGTDPCSGHTTCACKCSLYKAALAACPPP